MRFAGVSALCLGGAIALTGLAFLAIGDAGKGVSRLLVGFFYGGFGASMAAIDGLRGGDGK